MALVDTDIGFLPERPCLMSSGTASGMTFDTSTDVMAVICQVPRTGTIANVHYRISAVASPVMTHRIELRTVDTTTGLPNTAGTLYGSSTSITVDASTYAANTNYTAAVNATTATKGDVMAIVFDLSAFTSGNFTQVQRVSESLSGSSNGRATGFPYGLLNTAGSNVVNTTPPHGVALEYSGGTFYPLAIGNFWVGTVTNGTVTNSGVTRRGNKYTPTVKRRAIGMYANIDLDNDALLRLRLASDDSILATATLDANLRGGTSQQPQFYIFDSGTTVTISPGTEYYTLLEGNAAGTATLYGLTSAPSNAMLDIMPGGKNCFAVSYNAGYTETNTARNEIGLVTDQEDDGASSGGGGGGIGSRLGGGLIV